MVAVVVVIALVFVIVIVILFGCCRIDLSVYLT